MSVQHQYRGDLAKTTLPEILFSIDRFRVSGVIEAFQSGTVKRVFLKDGLVVHAASSTREDSLGDYLRRRELLSDESLRVLTRARDVSEKRFGVLLFERGVMSPEQVYSAIRQQVEEIVWSLFEWRSGEVTFTIGVDEPSHSVKIQLPLRQVIFQGIKRMDSAKELVSRLGRKDTVFESSFAGEDLIEISLSREEYQQLRKVDGRRTLYNLCSEGPGSPTDIARLLYAFHVLHLVKKVARKKDPPTGGVKIQLKTAGDRMGGS